MRGSRQDFLPFHEDASPARAAWFGRAWALAALSLIAVTWRLWTPQDAYPQVPLAPAGRLAPQWLDWLGLAGMLVGLAVRFRLSDLIGS